VHPLTKRSSFTVFFTKTLREDGFKAAGYALKSASSSY
jgi:hypothetical protein